jgi:hypothetical protein
VFVREKQPLVAISDAVKISWPKSCCEIILAKRASAAGLLLMKKHAAGKGYHAG